MASRSRRRRLYLELLEDRRVLATGAVTIDEFPPSGQPALDSAVNGIVFGPSNKLSFTEQTQTKNGVLINKIGEITTAGDTTQHDITDPSTTPPNQPISYNAYPGGIATGDHGSVWFAEGTGQIAKYDPASGGTFTTYPSATTQVMTFDAAKGTFSKSTPGAGPISGAHLTALTSYFDQNLIDFTFWFTDQGNDAIGMITPDGQTIKEFPLPKGGIGGTKVPFSIAEGPDGNIWFTELNPYQNANESQPLNHVGRITPDGAITEYALASAASTGGAFASPEGITEGPDGCMWFTEQNRQTIGRVTPAGVVTEYPYYGVVNQPAGIAAGADGKLYFTYTTTSGVFPNFIVNGHVGQFDPSLNSTDTTPLINALTTIDVPTSGNAAGAISLGPDGNMWLAEGHYTPDIANLGQGTYDGHIGRVNVSNYSQPYANVSIDSHVSPSDKVHVGDAVTFTMHVTNNSDTQTAKNVIVYDPVPANALYNGITISPTNAGQQASQFRGQTVSTLGDLAPHQSVTITMSLNALALGDITNRAYVVCDSQNLASATGQASVEQTATVQPFTTSFVMGGTLTVKGLTGVPNDPLKFDPNTGNSTTGTFNWALTRNPGGDPPQNVVVSMTIPSTLTDVVAYPANIFNYNDATRLLTFAWPTIASQDTVNFGFTARPTAVGNITVTATVKDDGVVTGIPLVGNPPLPGVSITTHVNTAVTSAKLGGVLLGDATGSPMQYDTATHTVVTSGIFGWQLTNTGDTTIKGASVTIPLVGQPVTPTVVAAYFTDILHPVVIGHYDDTSHTVTITGLPDLLANGKPLKFGFLADPTGVGQVSATATVTISGNFTATNSNAVSYEVDTKIERPTVSLSVDQDLEIADGPASDASGESTNLSGSASALTFNPGTNAPDSHGVFNWKLTNTSDKDATNVVALIQIPQNLKYFDNSASWFVSSSSNGKDATYFDIPFDTSLLRIKIPMVPAKSTAYFSFQADPRRIGPAYVTATITADQALRGDGQSLNDTIRTYVFPNVQHGHLYNLLNGPVVPNAHIIPIYYGSQWEDTTNEPKQVTDFPGLMQDAMASIVDSPYMDFLNQYTGGGYKVGRGDITNGWYQADSAPAEFTLNDSTIQQFVHDEVDAFAAANNGVPPDPINTVFVIYTPPETFVKCSWGDSHKDFLGYHSVVSYFHGFLNLQHDFYKYIVMPWNGGDNGHYANVSEFQSETIVFSHELAETVTDPLTAPSLGWRDDFKTLVGNLGPGGGVEIGDLASNINLQNEDEGAGDFGTLHGKYDDYLVQYLWADEYTYPGTNLTVFDQPVLPTGGAADTSQVKVYASGLLRTVTVIGGSGESASYSFSGTIGSFDDAKNATIDPTAYTATIDWGDGTTSDGTITYDANLKQYLISASHNFMAAAGSTATISIFVSNKVTGPLGKFSEVVTLQETSAQAAAVQFDQPAVDAYRNGSDAVITVDRTGDTTLGATVDYHVSGGTAVDGIDYQAESATLTFAPGDKSATILLPIYANPAATGDLTVILTLSNPIGNIVLGNQTTTTIAIHPADQVFTPPTPVLDTKSDTGTSTYDGITDGNGSPAAPLMFNITGASVRNGFLQLVDVTDPNNPVILGDQVQASAGAAAIKLAGVALADGTHKIAAINAVSATAGARRASQPTEIVIDTQAPTSDVSVLPGRTKITNLSVSWSGNDNTGGTGVQSYDISVSVDGGAPVAWLTHTTDTSANFASSVGHNYAFFATATDLAGNTEAAHAKADTTVVVTSKPWQNPANRDDVDGDTHVVPKDLVTLITYLNGHGATTLPADAAAGSSYYDCDGDGTAAPKDLVDIIIYLNGYGASEGEGSAAHSEPQTAIGNVSSDVLALLAADAALQSTRPRK